MTRGKREIYVGDTPLHQEKRGVSGGYVHLLGESYYRISHTDQMPAFFMSLVSSADHWLFIASSGGLTAGRIDADSALFPYETEDKITAHSEETGSKTIVRAARDGRTYLWEPFSERYAGLYDRERSLYKNIYGNKLVFEEVNHDLQLTFRLAWRTSDRFGFVRSCWLHNQGAQEWQIDLLDGLQNLLPYGATSERQTSLSSLLNAYKRSELDGPTGLGIFSLSATLTDRPEPSESLRATTVWQVGLDSSGYLLCSDQLDSFRSGGSLTPEVDLRGKAGAYLVNAAFELAADQSHHWSIVAEVNQDSSAIVKLDQLLSGQSSAIEEQIESDINRGTEKLVDFVAAADGLQQTAEQMTTAHHFANVLFNIMRGGIFADGYQVERDDLLDFMQVRNRAALAEHADWFAKLPASLSIQKLYQLAAESGEPDLIRLCYEYLPLIFSRRHGDPSRPWNRFAIKLKKRDGSPRLFYQGNWRDIFQNWEPLALSFPAYTEGMAAKFLNATTADGYNPYRVTRDGIEWEVPEPDNPWSNIGYWSDHQIIYLQKLLELSDQIQLGSLSKLWNWPIFAYADVPYRIRSYPEMLEDWNNTIDFDGEGERVKEEAVSALGTDGRLLLNSDGRVIHVTMTEKLLVLLLAKLVNLVPGGGIWMNTQRPEWNDANNALVGKGLSVVTTAYLRRFVTFWLGQMASVDEGSFAVNEAAAHLMGGVQGILQKYQPHLRGGFDDRSRRMMMDDLGMAGTAYRAGLYQEGLPSRKVELGRQSLIEFLHLAQSYFEQTLLANRREDGLFHSYNTLRLSEKESAVERLYLMLEGQVALLSSGMLSPDEALELLHKLRVSELYREDQHSYILYPNRQLPGFRQKNQIAAEQVAGSALAAAMTAAGDGRLLARDDAGGYHFNGQFRNANDVAGALDSLSQEPAYAEMAAAERGFLLDLFEDTFNHGTFTGRSGTFYAYEGLGSIYWHMVSKLLLAAQECYQQATDEGADPAVIKGLGAAYYDIREGIGFNKSPAVYGAFPTDPYSHTPFGGGARQPGMTGQVKEEILTRLGELGVLVRRGTLCFEPTLLKSEEFISEAQPFAYIDTKGEERELSLVPGSLAFTICQTAVVYAQGAGAKIVVSRAGQEPVTISGNCLDEATTQSIFDRDGQVELLQVTVAV